MSQTNIDINLLFNENDGLNKVLSKLEEVQNLQAKINQANIKLQSTDAAAEIERLNKIIQDLNAQLDEVKKKGKESLKSSADGAKAAGRTLKDLEDELKRLKKEQKGLLITDRAKAKEVGATIQRLDRQIKQFTALGKKNFNTFGNAIKSFGFKFNVMANLVSRVTSVTIMGFRKLVSSSVETITEFDQAQANLAALSGKTREEISGLTNSARELGATTAFTAVQVSELQIELSKLGFTTEEILSAQKGIIGLSTAFKVDVARAAEIAGSAIRGYNLDATDSQRVSDVLAKAFSSSALNLEKFGVASSKVAPLSAKLGISFEATTALLGKLSDAGFDASTSGTALRNIMLFLGDESSKLSKAIGKPIKSTEDLFEGFRKLSRQGLSLNDVLDITNRRTAAPLSALINLTEGANDLTEALKNAKGATDEFQEKTLNTLGGQITLIKSAWSDLVLSIQDGTGAFADNVKAAAKVFIEILNIASGAAKAREELDSVGLEIRRTAEHVISFTKSMLAMIPILFGLKRVLPILIAMRAEWKRSATFVDANTKAVVRNTTATRVWRTAQVALNTTLAATTAIIGSLLLTGFITWLLTASRETENWRKSTDALADAQDRLRSKVDSAVEGGDIGELNKELDRTQSVLKVISSTPMSQLKKEIDRVKLSLSKLKDIEDELAISREGVARKIENDKEVKAVKALIDSDRTLLAQRKENLKILNERSKKLSTSQSSQQEIIANAKAVERAELGISKIQARITDNVNKAELTIRKLWRNLSPSDSELMDIRDGLETALEQYIKAMKDLSEIGDEPVGVIKSISDELKKLKKELEGATSLNEINRIQKEMLALEQTKKQILRDDIEFEKKIAQIRLELIQDKDERERKSLRDSLKFTNEILKKERKVLNQSIENLRKKESLNNVEEAILESQRARVSELNLEIDLNEQIFAQRLKILETEIALRDIKEESADEVTQNQLKLDRDLANNELKFLMTVKQRSEELKSLNGQKAFELEMSKEKNKSDIEENAIKNKSLINEVKIQKRKADSLRVERDLAATTEEREKIDREILETENRILALGTDLIRNEAELKKLEQDRDDLNKKSVENAILAIEKNAELQAQILSKSIETATQVGDKIFDILKRESELRSQIASQQLQITENNIDRQQRLAEKGLDNTLAFERRRSQELQKIQADEARKQARLDQAKALFSLLAGYAQQNAPTALANAIKDIQLAKLNADGKAKDGGIVGDIIEGGSVSNGVLRGRTHSQGGILIEAEKEEGILSRKAMSNLGVGNFHVLRNALESGASVEFGNQKELLSLSTPILKADNRGVERRLEKIERAILNKPVSSSSIDNLGNVITKIEENGYKRITKKMRRKPRIG